MIITKERIRQGSRRSLKRVGLGSGFGSGGCRLVRSGAGAGNEASSQMMLLPGHYKLTDGGLVTFELETGETLSLTADQYLILEDGLLLITDDLAQASIDSLPVMGSVRAQMLSGLGGEAALAGGVAEAALVQTPAISDGQILQAPRLSEDFSLQTYELAQSADVIQRRHNSSTGHGHSRRCRAGFARGWQRLLAQPQPAHPPRLQTSRLTS